ncbi:unnamed protein product [Pseudo-nitzschia multistriata]|uniref:Uncharacterized protein n=1 Tax=Pseudo-nitzschia multistriata TaxID=183589 RepID=A0A448Z281_9STRA|nr:unnamed protein product [Pseudo-nitzschia multistriata]
MVYRSPYETEKQRLEKDLEKEVEEKGFPDVIITLYLSQFIYHMGDIRTRTKELGYGSGAEARTELINEVLRDAEAFQKLRDGGKSMAKLMRGKLHLNDINHDGLPDIPDINMDLVEHVLNNEKYKEVSESCADELDVMAIHSFKKIKFIYTSLTRFLTRQI